MRNFSGLEPVSILDLCSPRQPVSLVPQYFSFVCLVVFCCCLWKDGKICQRYGNMHCGETQHKGSTAEPNGLSMHGNLMLPPPISHCYILWLQPQLNWCRLAQVWLQKKSQSQLWWRDQPQPYVRDRRTEIHLTWLQPPTGQCPELGCQNWNTIQPRCGTLAYWVIYFHLPRGLV